MQYKKKGEKKKDKKIIIIILGVSATKCPGCLLLKDAIAVEMQLLERCSDSQRGMDYFFLLLLGCNHVLQCDQVIVSFGGQGPMQFYGRETVFERNLQMFNLIIEGFQNRWDYAVQSKLGKG